MKWASRKRGELVDNNRERDPEGAHGAADQVERVLEEERRKRLRVWAKKVLSTIPKNSRREESFTFDLVAQCLGWGSEELDSQKNRDVFSVLQLIRKHLQKTATLAQKQ